MSHAASTHETVLDVEDVYKSFGGIHALRGVSLQIRRAEVHALLGENGAGKSTLMKILAGIYPPDRGRILLRGKEVSFSSPKQSMDSGIGMVHQELCLSTQQSAAENVFLGRGPLTRFHLFDWKTLNRNARDIFDQLELDVDPAEMVGNLSVAKQQMVEIAKAISLNADVIILDEPTSSVTEEERVALFQMIRRLKGKGVAIVYISHRMEEIMEIADRFTILRDGQYIQTGDVKDVTIDDIIAGMVGRSITYVEHQGCAADGEVVFEVEDLARRGVFEGISFKVRRGEVLGLSGLVGAGRSEVARCIFGLDKRHKGTIKIDGRRCDIRSSSCAIRHGIGFVTENRKEDGAVLEMTIRENVTLPILRKISRCGFINRRRERHIAEQAIREHGVKAPSRESCVVNLSGGNQQKVIIAKWLATFPKVLILDEPTRGIDVGAKNEIYRMINQLTARGMAVIIISSEMPELLRMSDRIVVMREGRMTATLDRREATQDAIMRYALQ